MLMVYEAIRKAERGEIDELLTAALNRYREVYPGWDIGIISFEKDKDREEQLNRMIAFLERLR